MWKPVLLLGVSMLAGRVVPSHAQCGQINNCQTCLLESGVYKCVTCQDDGYAINSARTACCSVGCYQDGTGFAACYVNQTCVYEGCHTGFLGPKCTPCQSYVPNCDSCIALAGSSRVECVTCDRKYYRTTDGTQCCSNEGCDSCTGTNNAVCSVCKQGWFLYQNSCDKCGTTCVSPQNGTARCDPLTGSCYYGCQPNYHGSKCQRLCNLTNCNTCTYNEPSDNLTCAVCVAGRYGPYCTSCNSNCLRDTGDICIHNGTCLDGCKPGYQGDKCDVACDIATDNATGFANCAQCNRYEFICTVCKPGFWGSRCQFTCGVNCVPVGGASGQRYCNITDGTCRDGCMPTHFNHDCSGSCPNCGYDVCDRSTGTCLNPICDSGFYGDTCNQSCPVNCGLDPNGLAYCNFTSGDCTYGCRDGYYGAKCTLGCSQFCKRSPANTEKGPLCMQTTGNCVYACGPGSYTPTCGEVCRSTCVDKTCDISSGTCAECDKGANAGVLCPTGTCPAGLHGLFCNQTCAAGCAGTCDRYSSVCIGCDDALFGPQCSRVCGNCSPMRCDQNTGVCSVCQNGYYDSGCNIPCLFANCATCNKDSGQCSTCKTGFYGTRCDLSCSPNCAANINGVITCSKDLGHCDEQRCRPGYWDTTCTIQCSATCRSDSTGSRICQLSNGTCIVGCDDTYFGAECGQNCSASCVARQCGRTGVCSAQGCVTGRYGDRCEFLCMDTCNDNTCGRTSGVCDECNKLPQLQTALCRTAACPVGKHGLFCEYNCSSTCADTCGRMTLICDSCKPGYYGNQCESRCQNCAQGTCAQFTGTCDVRDAVCPTSTTGLYCNQTCPQNCLNGVCNRYTARCEACANDWWGANCTTPCGNCKGDKCNQDNGACASGCDDGYYSLTCTTPCMYSGCQACDNLGECVSCKQGKYGSLCSLNCSDKCFPRAADGRVYCEREFGVCSEGQCVPGYFRSTCTERCNGNCGMNPLAIRSCNIDTGRCTEECELTWFGPSCDISCPVNCANQNCNRTGECRQGCKAGYWGPKCELTCAVTCNVGTCDQALGSCLECSKPTPTQLCREAACPVGKHGLFCEYNCSSTCADTCGRMTLICDSCKPGYYGNQCESRCQNCAQGTCAQFTGTCDVRDAACPVGKHGLFCEYNCSSTCADTCGRMTLICDSCKPGYYGNQCESRCQNCAQGTCAQFTGTCDVRCVDGFYTDSCTKSCLNPGCSSCDRQSGQCVTCKTGLYGTNCDLNCSAQCLPSNTGIISCNKTNGACLIAACKPGYYGNACVTRCPVNCLSNANDNLVRCDFTSGICTEGCIDGRFGPTCESQCNQTCAGSAKRCQRDGVCSEGCVNGFYGDYCQNACIETCTDDKCDRKSGDCADCLQDRTPLCRDAGCADGFYGSDCSLSCNANCVNKACDDTTAACRFGCNGSMYYGSTCNNACNANCLGGTCNRTGYCLTGCKVGSYGDQCQLTCQSSSRCNDGTCGRVSGICDDCQVSPPSVNCPSAAVSSSTDSNNPDTHNDSTPLLAAALGGSVGGFAAGVALVIVIIMLRRRYRVKCPCQRREESGDQSDNSDIYARINANASGQEGHMYAGLHANRNSEYDVVEPGHLETNMNQLHQGAYVRLDSRLRNQQIYNSLTTPQPQSNSEPESVDSQL